MSKEAMKLALEALDVLLTEPIAHKAADRAEYLLLQAAPAIREALAEQPAQQEPVAYGVLDEDGQIDWTCEYPFSDDPGWPDSVPLYTSPPASKPWVGLTDKEMRELEKQFNAERVRTSDEEYLIIYPSAYWAWQRAIEAKLREKNHG